MFEPSLIHFQIDILELDRFAVGTLNIRIVYLTFKVFFETKTIRANQRAKRVTETIREFMVKKEFKKLYLLNYKMLVFFIRYTFQNQRFIGK